MDSSNAKVFHENVLLKEERARMEMHLQQLTRKTQDLEEMLLNTTQELQRERENSRSIVVTLTDRLMESREMINKLEIENMRLRKDCILAVGLLQCNKNVDREKIVTTIDKLSDYVDEPIANVAAQKTRLKTADKNPDMSSNHSETQWKRMPDTKDKSYNMALLQYGVPCDYDSSKTSHLTSSKEQVSKKDAIQHNTTNQRYNKIDKTVNEKVKDKHNDTKMTTKANKKGKQGNKREERPLIEDETSKEDEQLENIDKMKLENKECSYENLESPENDESTLLNQDNKDGNGRLSKIEPNQELQTSHEESVVVFKEDGSRVDGEVEERSTAEDEGLLDNECSTLVDNVMVNSREDEHSRSHQRGEDGGLDEHGRLDSEGGLDRDGKDDRLKEHRRDGDLRAHSDDGSLDQHGKNGVDRDGSFDNEVEIGPDRTIEGDADLLVDNVSPSEPTRNENNQKDIEDDSEDTPLV